MWFPVSTLAAIFVFCDCTEAVGGNENDLEILFKERSHSDWKNAWHKERYSRCRETLIRHLYWACEKDIYRLTRRSEPNSVQNFYDDEGNPWLAPKKAKKMLRFRRSSAPSITNECCKSTGCTWEEYAEYCPTNKRYTPYVK